MNSKYGSVNVPFDMLFSNKWLNQRRIKVCCVVSTSSKHWVSAR